MMRAVSALPTPEAAPSPANRQRKELLLAAGVELFDELNFDLVTVDMVAERADVARGLVAYYFGNKEGLYRAVSERFGLVLRRHLLENPHEDPARWLEADVNAFLDVVEAHPVAIRNTARTGFRTQNRRTPMTDFTVQRILAVLGAHNEDPLVRLIIASWGLQCVDMALRWLDEPEIARDDIAAVMVASLRSALAAVSLAHAEFGLPARPFG
jgi:AcrR family transcriptional regulator